MVLPPVFYAFAGLWGAASIALLISAARLCYRIEARSGRRPLKWGLPGYANVIPAAFNIGVARDAETQGLRRRMNGRLAAILAGFAIFYIFLWATGALSG